eukprot:1184621-Rhodomonas_salina.1
MSGTHLAHAATGLAPCVPPYPPMLPYLATLSAYACYAIPLCACYAMPGTNLAHAGTRKRPPGPSTRVGSPYDPPPSKPRLWYLASV